MLHLELADRGEEAVFARIIRPQADNLADIRIMRIMHGASRRELVDPPLVHRSPPRGHERVQFDLLLLGQGAPVPKIEELREAAALLRSEDVIPFRGVIKNWLYPRPQRARRRRRHV